MKKKKQWKENKKKNELMQKITFTHKWTAHNGENNSNNEEFHFENVFDLVSFEKKIFVWIDS